MRFIVIAPDFTNQEISSGGYLSPAAAAWSQDFLNILGELGHVKSSFWYKQISGWPRGALKIEGELLPPLERQRSLVGFPNFPHVKVRAISAALRKKALACAQPTDNLIIYGQRTLHPSDLKKLRLKVGRVLLIVPDARPGLSGLREIEKVAVHADGLICLPHSLSSSLPKFPNLSFQGHVGSLQESNFPKGSKKKLVFVGGVDKTSGVGFLREALELVDTSAVEVDVIGRVGDPTEAERLTSLGVRVRGFVSHEEMQSACLSAFAFLNPRDPRDDDSAANFPSKLLNYFQYGRPIVSTNTVGLPPDLAKAIGCETVVSPEDFAGAIEQLIQMTDSEVEGLAAHIQKLVREKFSKAAAIQKISGFLEEIGS